MQHLVGAAVPHGGLVGGDEARRQHQHGGAAVLERQLGHAAVAEALERDAAAAELLLQMVHVDGLVWD